MKKVIYSLYIAIFVLLVSGCVTTKGYEQTLQSWVGMSEGQLLRKWGIPSQTFNSGGRKYLEYISSRDVYIPGTNANYTTRVIGNTIYTDSYGGSDSRNINFKCKTTFEIKNGRVAFWRYEGNNCKAPEKSDEVHSYETVMRNVASQIKNNKKYTRISLNTDESKKWFKNLTYKLWSGKINKHTFIKEGLKRYPDREYEFTWISNKL